MSPRRLEAACVAVMWAGVCVGASVPLSQPVWHWEFAVVGAFCHLSRIFIKTTDLRVCSQAFPSASTSEGTVAASFKMSPSCQLTKVTRLAVSAHRVLKSLFVLWKPVQFILEAESDFMVTMLGL